jgi:hypothetical protein
LTSTVTGPSWDGFSALPLACGAGTDFPAGNDPDAETRVLEEPHCDPAIREPFITTLVPRTMTDPPPLAGQ